MRTSSTLKTTLLVSSAMVWSLCVCHPVSAAHDDATRNSAGQRAAAAIRQRDAESDIRQRLPIMVMERRSETAIANNRHNLNVIDNVVGKVLEILSLALGVALIVSSAVEQKEKREEIARIAVGAGLILFGLFCPRMVHSICNFISVSIFH